MDTILNLVDIFGLDANKFNPILLIPVLFVIVGAAAVFIFGFKRADSPKFRKSVESSANIKRKKSRNSPGVATELAHTVPHVAGKTPQQQQTATKAVKKQTPVKTATTVAATLVKKSPTVAAKTSIAPKTKSSGKKSTTTVSAAHTLNLDGDALAAGGEWQTVITKKQKKQTDPLIQAVADVAKAASGNVKGNKPSATTNKKKESSNNAKNKKEQPLLIAEQAKVKEPVSIFEVEQVATPTTTTATHNTASFLEPRAAVSVAIFTPAAAATPQESVAFDELGGAVWTETKPQKKRRALRE